ncbi:MAG: tetratricopeptide (TPR) repeat protein [Pseudohongiellaceae bacterium]|jgi:tetratricopeptide (TPR) repeat protein
MSAAEEVDPVEKNELLSGALAFLAGEGRHRSPEHLLSGLYERFADAGQQKLADLVYEMCKARLAVLPDFAARTHHHIEPREPGDIKRDMTVMRESMRGVAELPSLSPADSPMPPGDNEVLVLDDVERCVAVLATLEGESPRQQLVLGSLHCQRGQPERAEPLLRALLDHGELDSDDEYDAIIQRCAHVNLAFTLHRQERSAEALDCAEEALQRYPDRETLHFTAIGSASDLGDRSRFDKAVSRLLALQRATPKALISAWIAHDLGRVARRVGLSDTEVACLVAGASR